MSPPVLWRRLLDPRMSPLPALRPAAAVTVSVTPSPAAAGSKVTISGGGYKPGELIDVQLATSQPASGVRHLAYATADASGNFSVTNLTIPADLAAGAYMIVAVGL